MAVDKKYIMGLIYLTDDYVGLTEQDLQEMSEGELQLFQEELEQFYLDQQALDAAYGDHGQL